MLLVYLYSIISFVLIFSSSVCNTQVDLNPIHSGIQLNVELLTGYKVTECFFDEWNEMKSMENEIQLTA